MDLIQKIKKFEEIFYTSLIDEGGASDKKDRQRDIVMMMKSLDTQLGEYLDCEDTGNFEFTDNERGIRILCCFIMFYYSSILATTLP